MLAIIFQICFICTSQCSHKNSRPWIHFTLQSQQEAMVGFKSARPTLPFSCMQLQSSRVRLVEASPHDLVSPSDEARCVPRESRFPRLYGPHVFRQTAGVCSRIMRNRARRTCTRDQLHSDLRNILYNGMCSQSSVCRHFLTCQQVANISSCAARCQLSVQLELSEHA